MYDKFYEKSVIVMDYIMFNNSIKIHELIDKLKINVSATESRTESARKIAKKISDKELIDIINKSKPTHLSSRADICFHGKYYTYTPENGLELKDTSHISEEMVKNAINDLTENGINFLKAIIKIYKEKGDRIYHGCIMDDILTSLVELGYKPSYPSGKTISTLTGYKIMVVGGSNRYKEYIISKELIPIIDKYINSDVLELEYTENINEGIDVNEDIFDSIIGYDSYKRSMIRALRAKKPVHVMLIGPPASGKTLFMLQIHKHIPGAEYFRGEHKATKAGIVEFVIERKPSVLLIDEIAEMRPQDRNTLLGITDNGIVTVLKHNEHKQVKVNTRVWCATTKPERLGSDIKSRFRIYRFRKYTPNEYIKVVKHYLPKEENVDEDFAEYIAIKLSKFTTDVRDAIKVARMCTTKSDVDEEIQLMYRNNDVFN